MLALPFRLVWNVLGNLLVLLANLVRLPSVRHRPRWVRLALDGALPARSPRRRGLLARRTPSLETLAAAVTDLAADPRLTGVVVEIDRLPLGWARLASVRAVLLRLRAAGKRVVVHLSSPGPRELYVATAGDAILCDESGPLTLTGLAAEVTFWGGALERVGAEAQAEYRGAYKSFAEVWTRRDMSPAHREATEAILDGLSAELRAAFAAARGITAERAEELLVGGPYPAARAAELGIIDAVRYRDEVEAWLGDGVRLASLGEWRRRRLRPLTWRPLLRRPRRVRIVALHGSIVPGEGGTFPRPLLGDRPACRLLAAARRDRRVAAVVLHVSSPGGGAAASDLMWREVVRLAKTKPVVAYLDDVAASGGYYLACAATRIVAQPVTLTGSIGVVAGKLHLAGLYERLGIGKVQLRRGPAAGMHSTARPYSDEERGRLAAEVDALYEQFVRKVADGRKLPFEAAEAAARGRVWLGADAHARGLVDVLGDLEVALEEARGLARRHPGERLVVEDVSATAGRGLLARLVGGREGLAWLVGELPDGDELSALLALGDARALYLAPSVTVG